MKIGYARVSTQDQNLSMQLDALKAQGCEKIFQEKASGTKADRPELTKLLEHVRVGDTVVIWKLDRLGRSLAHLVEMVNVLEREGIGLISLNDPVDTTTAQGRLVFRIFASLAEFERELIKERTQAGLQSARRRGQRLGRPTGLSKEAQNKSRIAESLYKEGKLSVKDISKLLDISKSTLYVYLRSRGIVIGQNLIG
ncbi:recombinase family protein [Spirosoma endbachense]|uniref:Resolvase n=1 Tax=Spirosoma endbachense TaxID=2666025 RepID=A0A6P1W0S4_9BACT|nr:recombinase family protein [Spirosoma endbachense]QHV97902.1 resolvase [Spirosoma endbachense]